MADRPAGDEPIHFRVLRDTRHTDPTEYKHVRTLTKPIHVRPEGYEIVLNGEPRAVLTYEDKDDRDVITVSRSRWQKHDIVLNQS